MKMKCCENGHYYDSVKFAACPHCQMGDDMKKTEKFAVTEMIETEYMPVTETIDNEEVTSGNNLTEVIKRAKNVRNIIADDAKTVSFYSEQGNIGNLAVGILLCVEGNDFGSTYLLKAGRNFVGRSQSMDVVIARDTKVSRERHAIIVYDPKSRSFIAQSGNASGLVYINEHVVLNPEILKAYDEILIGDTKLIFVPICNEQFAWENYRK